MKISIIIPSFNQVDFLESAIKSVLAQKGDFKLEPIVIDGGSTDGSLKILKKYNSVIKWVSEKDKGQSDAINKGVRLSSGNIIGWLNSDDIYMHGALDLVSKKFNLDNSCQWLYGKCKIIGHDGNELRTWITRYKNYHLLRYSYKKLLIENFVSQPSVFFKKTLFNEVGGLKASLDFAMDYDLWLRFGELAEPAIINNYLSAFRKHTSSKSENNYVEQFKEELEVARNYTKSGTIRLLHQINIWKIILAYKIIK